MSDERKGIKSAFELAMERFGEASGGASLTDEQKQALAAIDRETQAKVAEQEILYKSRIRDAQMAGNLEETNKLREEMAVELRRIAERGETKKEEVRQGRGGGP